MKPGTFNSPKTPQVLAITNSNHLSSRRLGVPPKANQRSEIKNQKCMMSTFPSQVVPFTVFTPKNFSRFPALHTKKSYEPTCEQTHSVYTTIRDLVSRSERFVWGNKLEAALGTQPNVSYRESLSWRAWEAHKTHSNSHYLGCTTRSKCVVFTRQNHSLAVTTSPVPHRANPRGTARFSFCTANSNFLRGAILRQSVTGAFVSINLPSYRRCRFNAAFPACEF